MKKEPSTLINKLKKSIFHVFPKLKRNSNNYIFKRSQTQKKIQNPRKFQEKLSKYQKKLRILVANFINVPMIRQIRMVYKVA